MNIVPPINMELFHFLRPWWLLALPPFLAAVALLARRRGGASDWRRVVAAELLPHVLQSGGGRRFPFASLLGAVAGVLAIVALAGPTWERIPQPVFREAAALVIVLDLSRSMDAVDIKPSRLQRAKFKITDILKSREQNTAGGHTALVVYAADAFTVAPLTDDSETILAQLPALSTDLMPAQGSRIDRALALAAQLLRQAGQAQGHILLLSDGAQTGAGVDAAARVAADGYRLSILGLGTAAGAPIPTGAKPADKGILKDANGNIVIAALDARALSQIAAAGGGAYATARADDADIAALRLNEVAAHAGQEKQDDRIADIWKEIGPWLLLPVLPLAALAFRRGILAFAMCALLPVLLSAPPPAAAQTQWWDNLWQTPDAQAQKLLEADQPAQAAKRYQNPAWRATAHYRAGDYEKAAAAFRALPGAAARYNEGNALAKAGRLHQAIEAYDQALEAAPDHADAAYNKALIEELLRQAEQQQQQQSDENGEQGEQSEQQQSAQSGAAGEQSEQQQGESADQSDQQTAAAEDDPSTADPTEQNESTADETDDATPAQTQATEQNPTQDSLSEEQLMARRQWLTRIPDDPGGLLKRKFQHQYRQRARQDPTGQQW